MAELFDYFLSYKQRDSAVVADKLARELKTRSYNVWLDSDQVHPGESILASIERGIGTSIDAIVLMSPNYLTGWSEQERRALFGLMTRDKLRIVPIWYGIDDEWVQQNAPLFSDMKAIPLPDDSDAAIVTVCDWLSQSFNPDQRRSRLFELFFRCLVPHFPDDADLRIFLAVFDGDVASLQKAVDDGADVNITDTALWNRYNRVALDCGCWPEWRKLFLYLTSKGLIGQAGDEPRGQQPQDEAALGSQVAELKARIAELERRLPQSDP